MKLRPGCADCLKRKHTAHHPAEAEKEKINEYKRRVTALVDESCGRRSSPETIQRIHGIYRELFGPLEDFSEEKKRFNALMLEIEAKVQEQVDAAPLPLLRAVQYALIGNYIDFAALGNVEEDKLLALLEDAGSMNIDDKVWQQFLDELSKARSLVYLTDNCGEIVLDKILMRTLRAHYPQLQIGVVVRGKPVFNDATLEDAQQTGLDQVASWVIGNGCDLAGHVLSGISEESRERLEQADLIISKGQANYEGLSGCALPIYYMLLCKCQLFMDLFQTEKFSPVLAREPA